MNHSKNYKKVKRYYNMKLWDEAKMRNAVEQNYITEEEFLEITGIAYK